MSRLTQRGMTMVEALVALIVLSIGMLGIATLYLTTLHAARSAISRMQAVNLVADLSDRIRANRTAGAAYAGAPANNNCSGGAISAAVVCTPAQMAADDLNQWQGQVASGVMGLGAAPVATVVVVAGATPLLPNTYTITVTWTEAEAGQKVNLSYVVNFEL